MCNCKERFNGYANFETFSIAIMLENDRTYYEWVKEMARDRFAEMASIDITDEARHDATAHALARNIERLYQSRLDTFEEEDTSGFLASFARTSLERVNFYEIALEWLDDEAFPQEEKNEILRIEREG